MLSTDTDNDPENVNGIIMVLTCKKYLTTRVKELNIMTEEINKDLGWKTIFVYGDLFMKDEFISIIDNNKIFLKIKCEDSYFHLFKKMVLAFKYLHKIYNIKEGVLRLGDDLIINNANLYHFLEIQNKQHYIGSNKLKKNYIPDNANSLKITIEDYFMVDYYKNNPADLENTEHNLAGIHFNKYIKRPYIPYIAGGVIVYYSKYASQILYECMSNINFNVLHFDEFSNSYPYIIEDVAVAFILYRNYIPLYYYPMYADTQTEYNLLKKCIGLHTNKYKL